ncbi:MAG: alpha/beta fold hydrolase [Caldilineaceae bacterium]|nr:alpha/beta fold hydrolase [Caldilineaceae bacterium]
MQDAVERVIVAHHAAGKEFEAGGVRSFVRAQGEGDPIVLFHGIPASSYLYRKVIPLLAARGFRALAFDLPGLGFAGRPVNFDYTFSGLGRWAAAAVDALGLTRFHLVVHDAGGPVGFEMAATMPARICSLTLLNTVVDLDAAPFAMEFYARFATGEHWPALPPRRATRELLYRVGIGDRSATPPAEVDVYRELVLREDNGRAYLHLMRNLDGTRKRGADYSAVVNMQKVPYPVQVIWSADDRTLPLRRHGWKAREATGLDTIQTLPGKHYFQEDRAPEIAATVAGFAAKA